MERAFLSEVVARGDQGVEEAEEERAEGECEERKHRDL
jgi:hypothetical protein